jgi:hypothetical protein
MIFAWVVVWEIFFRSAIIRTIVTQESCFYQGRPIFGRAIFGSVNFGGRSFDRSFDSFDRARFNSFDRARFNSFDWIFSWIHFGWLNFGGMEFGNMGFGGVGLDPASFG